MNARSENVPLPIRVSMCDRCGTTRKVADYDDCSICGLIPLCDFCHAEHEKDRNLP